MASDDDGVAIFRISTRGVSDRGVSGATRKQREVQGHIRLGLESAARRGIIALRAAAPISPRGSYLPADDFKGSRPRHTPVGRNLKDSIGVTGERLFGRNPNIRIGSSVQSERKLNYTSISRRGRGIIVPKVARRGSSADRPAARELTDGGQGTGTFIGRRAMLRFPDRSGKIIYRFRVGPWRPTRDWVEGADPAVRASADAAMTSAGNQISRTLGRGGRVARVRQL